jgi:hypothetical protein
MNDITSTHIKKALVYYARSKERDEISAAIKECVALENAT